MIPDCMYCRLTQAVCRLERTEKHPADKEPDRFPSCEPCADKLLKLEGDPYKRIPLETT